MVFQQGSRRNGILETVQVIPTSTPPTARDNARVNKTLNSTDSKENVPPLNPYLKAELALKTNFSRPVNDHADTTVESGIHKASNGPQNLVSYSLDPPNSFPQPTSIPPIDTLSATWPTPMGSIDSEMDDIGIPPTLEPIGNEMSGVDKIPKIEGISSVGQIPLSYEEESPWERSHATSGDVLPGHAIRSHASDTVSSAGKSGETMLRMKNRNETVANATRRGKVAENPQDFSKDQHFSSTKLTSLKVERQRTKKAKDNSNLLLHVNKHKTTGNTLHVWSSNTSSKSKKRVAIPPPKPIDPIQPLLEKFQREKEVGDISEHTLDFEPIKPHEAIDKHLLPIESQPKIAPIKEHLSTEQLDTIEPIENHQIATNE